MLGIVVDLGSRETKFLLHIIVCVLELDGACVGESGLRG